ncbi:FxsC protein [Streptomyces lucensis]|uniref:FxsC protein n=1 Tax=Streptomyces lucensis TaxID=67319 RepID=UPI0016749C78|nr:FxsC protein [Streptomyces lucensis]
MQRFHADVQTEVYSILGRHPRNEGFLQRAEPATGPDPSVLVCRTLLVLYSADYLNDRQCALEWSVFRERMQRRQWLTGEPADALIGVLWRADSLVLPRAVADTGQLLDDLGEGYQGPGVAGLQDDPGGDKRYRGLVRQVAARLTRAARKPLPAMTESESAAVGRSFGPRRGQRAARRERSPAPPPRPGERHLVLALLAGTRAGMERLRTSVGAYADSPEEWRPFRPFSDEPAAAVAARAARACGIDRLTVVPVEDSGPDPLREAGASAVIVVLVDPWMTADPSFSVRWERLAGAAARVAAVITVLPRQDQESRRDAGRLREALARTPARQLGASHHEAGSQDSLTHAMAAVVADAFADAGEEEPLPGRADELPVENTAERIVRRERERAGWLRHRAPWPPLLSGTPRESWGGG